MVTKKKTTVAPSKTIVATEAKPVARAVRRRQVAKGDVPPVLTEEGIEDFTVRAAVEGAQAAKMGAMRDVIAGMSPEESAALLRGLLKQQGESAEELSISPDDELVKDWRDGGYPYKNLMQRRNYERQKYRLQVELLKLQAWVKETGQAFHGTPQSARCARRGAGKAERHGAWPMVLPALRAAFANQW